jgi:magnesium chelatase family protein
MSSDNENSATIKRRVEKSRTIQKNRYDKFKISGKKYNSEMGVSDIEKMIKLSHEVSNILTTSAEKLALSARAYHRIIKLARTIADLENSVDITKNHILEALQYRQKNT